MFVKALGAANLETADVSGGVSDLLACKDQEEIKKAKRAAYLAATALQKYAVPQFESELFQRWTCLTHSSFHISGQIELACALTCSAVATSCCACSGHSCCLQNACTHVMSCLHQDAVWYAFHQQEQGNSTSRIDDDVHGNAWLQASLMRSCRPSTPSSLRRSRK